MLIAEAADIVVATSPGPDESPPQESWSTTSDTTASGRAKRILVCMDLPAAVGRGPSPNIRHAQSPSSITGSAPTIRPSTQAKGPGTEIPGPRARPPFLVPIVLRLVRSFDRNGQIRSLIRRKL